MKTNNNAADDGNNDDDGKYNNNSDDDTDCSKTDTNTYLYYGRNDLRPLKTPTRVCIYIASTLLSPLLLVLSVVYIIIVLVFVWFMPLHKSQIKAGKLLGYEAWWRSPGIQLEVNESTTKPNTKHKHASFDIIIPKDFITKDGKLDTCKKYSLRKSIEYTVQEHLRYGHFGSEIFENDTDRMTPQYLLHGWSPEEYDPHGDEVWTTHARTATWAAIYSWSSHLPGLWTEWNTKIDYKSTTLVPDVLGHIYLFQVTNPNLYDTADRIVRIGQFAYNSPDHTKETDGKVFARYNYGEVKYMGDFPDGDPDAYIFKGKKVLDDAKLKILHHYRVMNPRTL